MNDNGFAEQIRKTAEALQDLLRAAHDEEKRVAEELHKEKARRKLECSTACQRVLLPTMKLFAMGLEAAKVFAPQCWKVDYEPNDDQYCCICWHACRRRIHRHRQRQLASSSGRRSP